MTDAPKPRPKHRQRFMDLVEETKLKDQRKPAPRKKPSELPKWLQQIDKMRCEYCNMVHLGMDCPSKPKQKQPNKSNKRQE